MAKKKVSESFEKSLQRLEEIADLLENEEIGLDESIKLYEEGILLSKICYTKLKDAELKITELKSQFEDELGDE
jgi:exodeoxyribonuclease VII small subunit